MDLCWISKILLPCVPFAGRALGSSEGVSLGTPRPNGRHSIRLLARAPWRSDGGRAHPSPLHDSGGDAH
eukprot:scaffold24492_cov48-Phaeocystis_antarctica.AAC.1